VASYYNSSRATDELHGLTAADTSFVASRKWYTSSPLARIKDASRPGVQFYNYNNNIETRYQTSDGDNLLEGVGINAEFDDRFNTTATADPNGNQKIKATDRLGRVTANQVGDALTKQLYDYYQTHFAFNKQQLPNHFTHTPPSGDKDDNWFTHWNRHNDLQGLDHEIYYPDEGSRRLISNYSGQPVFEVWGDYASTSILLQAPQLDPVITEPAAPGQYNQTDLGDWTITNYEYNNLASDGSFESASPAFESDYARGSMEQGYEIVSYQEWLSEAHHGEKFMAVTEASTANAVIWSETVTLDPGINVFALRLADSSSVNKAQLAVRVNGTQQNLTDWSCESTGEWEQFSCPLSASGTVAVELINLNPNFAIKQKFAIDNIIVLNGYDTYSYLRYAELDPSLIPEYPGDGDITFEFSLLADTFNNQLATKVYLGFDKDGDGLFQPSYGIYDLDYGEIGVQLTFQDLNAQQMLVVWYNGTSSGLVEVGDSIRNCKVIASPEDETIKILVSDETGVYTAFSAPYSGSALGSNSEFNPVNWNAIGIEQNYNFWPYLTPSTIDGFRVSTGSTSSAGKTKYMTYDELGKKVGSGIIAGHYTPAQLETYANAPLMVLPHTNLHKTWGYIFNDHFSACNLKNRLAKTLKFESTNHRV
ncbi:MAG: hypothetical protein AAF485_29215, partial [Chloroflexota bacterium]